MTKAEKKIVEQMPVDQVDALVTEHALASYQLVKRRAQLEKKLAEIRTEFGAEIPELENQISSITEKLCVWLTGNRTLLSRQKSLNFTNGCIGMHDNPASVAMTKGITAEEVIVKLQAMDGGEQFVRMGKATLNKDAIKEAFEAFRHQFECIGLELKRSETFYVTPKAEPATAAADASAT
jgi:phage host-nuclease inhibitor protein Gam